MLQNSLKKKRPALTIPEKYSSEQQAKGEATNHEPNQTK